MCLENSATRNHPPSPCLCTIKQIFTRFWGCGKRRRERDMWSREQEPRLELLLGKKAKRSLPSVLAQHAHAHTHNHTHGVSMAVLISMPGSPGAENWKIDVFPSFKPHFGQFHSTGRHRGGRSGSARLDGDVHALSLQKTASACELKPKTKQRRFKKLPRSQTTCLDGSYCKNCLSGSTCVNISLILVKNNSQVCNGGLGPRRRSSRAGTPIPSRFSLQ